MIVLVQRERDQASRTSHADFERLLPRIREQAQIAFRFARPEAREDLVAEVAANAFCAFVRLVQLGKSDLAYATPLAQHAIRQVRSGRRVGSQCNVRDVSSRYAQLAKGITLERLDRYDVETGEWREALIEDRRTGPAETAAARIDVAAWFRQMAPRNRKIAKALAGGESTSRVARQHGLSAGRVSQLRRELRESWEVFQGESKRQRLVTSH
jgi:DNA-binding NarL/FixJ family response regulator